MLDKRRAPRCSWARSTESRSSWVEFLALRARLEASTRLSIRVKRRELSGIWQAIQEAMFSRPFLIAIRDVSVRRAVQKVIDIGEAPTTFVPGFESQ